MNRIIDFRSAGIGFFIVLTIFGVCFGRAGNSAVPFTVSKETTAIVEPLKADGTVDYVAAVNQLYGKGVTPENNGYVIFLRAAGTDTLQASIRAKTLAELGVAQADLPAKGFDVNGPDDLPERPWKAGDNPGVAKYLAANDSFLNLAVAASQKPMWWDSAVSPDGTIWQVLLPSLNRLRVLSRSLCCRALLREGTGDFDGFVSDVMTVKRLSRLAAGWTMISRLVCANMDCGADDTIGVVVGGGTLTSARCNQLAKALDGVSPLMGVADVIDMGERWSTLEFVALIAVRNHGVGALLGDNRFRLAELDRGDIDWDIVLRRMNQRTDDVVAIVRDPKMLDARELDKAINKGLEEVQKREPDSPNLRRRANESQEAYSNRVADAGLLVMSPAVGKAVTTMRAGRMRDEMVRALVAAGEFRADNSHWPGTLGELVPKYLAVVPRDIYSPSAADAVRYLQSDAGVFIYSVGVNRVDDGGLNDSKLKQDDVGEGIMPKAGEQGL